MKGPCLISGFFDCCRVFASDKSQPEGVPESSRSTALRRLVRAGSTSHVPVEKVMFYATSRGSKADDGKDGSGGECMPRHQCLSAEYVCSPVVANLSVAYIQNVTCLRKHDYGVYSISKYVSGVFTRYLHKFLQQPNVELGEVITSVKTAVGAFKGSEQKPVREFN